MPKNLERVAEQAVEACGRFHTSLHQWQDCARGVNIAKRLTKKRGLKVGRKAALRVCKATEKDRGPRRRCFEGVRFFTTGV